MPENELIVGLVRNEPLVVADCSVIKPEGPNRAMQQVLERAQGVTKVFDEASQRKAWTVAQELQGLRNGLQANYKNAKQPVTALGRAIDNTFHELDRPMEVEYRRLDRLVSTYQDELKRKAELEKARAEAESRERERKERERLAELERAKEQAELKLRLAEGLREKKEAERTIKALVPEIEEQKVMVEVQAETVPITYEEKPDRPPGGRVWTQYIIEITDALALANAHPELVTITPKQAACQEFAKTLDEAGKPMVCPGLRMRKVTRTSFTGAAAIRIETE